MIDAERGFAYIRIPKAANSFVVSALTVGENVAGAKAAARTLADLRFCEAVHVCGLYRFAFVRNPFVRTLSAYLDKLRPGERLEQSFGREIARYDATSEVSFAAYCRWLEAGGETANGHFLAQWRYLDLISGYDRIGRVETLHRDLSKILEEIGLPIPKIMSRTLTGGPVTTNASDRMAEYYTTESAAIVARVYARDFARLRYSTDLSEAR